MILMILINKTKALASLKRMIQSNDFMQEPTQRTIKKIYIYLLNSDDHLLICRVSYVSKR